ncbi:hypothetical protein [Sulfurovum sp. NBC37-1]|uniref:hypothetical protein n=1 Tax=Sulfurovum sp. (strain NBC37-1) TaxID=387093 RepID=UPI000A0295BB|nr:hypothetical protein [Sulfurovum sp. NBC37-1]
MNKRKTGQILIFSSLFIWILNRTTGVISNILGQILYGDDYMRPVNGVVGDMSYGFNTDMHLAFSLVVIFIFGLVLYISSKKSKLLDLDSTN